MDETVIEVVDVTTALPLKHQLGMALFATAVAFVASKAAEKGYVAGYHKFQTIKLEKSNG